MDFSKYIVMFLYHCIIIFPLGFLCLYPFGTEVRLSPKKLYPTLCGILLALCLAISAITYDIPMNDPSRVVTSVTFSLLGLIALNLLVNKSFLYVFFVFSLSIHFSVIATAISNLLDNWLQATFPYPAYPILRGLVISLAYSPLLFYLMGKKLRPFLSKPKQLPVSKMFGGVPITFTLIHLFLENYVVEDMIYFLVSLILSISALFVYTLLFQVIHESTEIARIEENQRMTNQLLSLQSSQYSALMERLTKTKTLHHDLHHHLSIIAGLLENKNFDELSSYLAEYTSTQQEPDPIMYTNNYPINTILVHYAQIARSKGADIDIKILFSQKTQVKDTDLCIIFGNLLENAIEAVSRSNDGFIRIRAKADDDIMVITVVNSFKEKPKKKGDIYLSSKREGEGTGIYSVNAVAKKYNGKLDIEVEGNVFHASVILYTTPSSGDSAPQVPEGSEKK